MFVQALGLALSNCVIESKPRLTSVAKRPVKGACHPALAAGAKPLLRRSKAFSAAAPELDGMLGVKEALLAMLAKAWHLGHLSEKMEGLGLQAPT